VAHFVYSKYFQQVGRQGSTPKYYFNDNGILNLFLLDGQTSLLENLVAITLLRRYGREEAVFFYHKRIEVDFYLPDTATAIQVCYSLDNTDGTFDREVGALVKLTKVFDCSRLMIITYSEERIIQIEGKIIEVLPIWKWLLDN